MENLNLADLKLSQEELIDIIKFLAKKRNIKNYKRKWSNELLQAIKQNKINKQQSKIKERIDNIREDYYKPILVKSGYNNNNYIQYESKRDKILTLKEYLALIEKYLRKLINYYKNKNEWKVQLIAEISFISLKPGSDETRIMHTRSDNEEFMNGSDTAEIIKGLFESFLQKYEENLQEKMKGSEFEFDGINFLYYDFNKISLNRGGSYIDSPK